GAVFVFEAEDGIRDWSVTGVQTCALPIWALALLPDTAECAQVKRQARAALFAEIAKNLVSVAEQGWIGWERLHAHVLTGLQAVQIGRASCRERVELAVGAGGWSVEETSRG